MNNLTNLLTTGCSESHILTYRIGNNCHTTYGEASKSAEYVVTQRKEGASSGGEYFVAVRKPSSNRCRLVWHFIHDRGLIVVGRS
jgi:hypothetical protein